MSDHTSDIRMHVERLFEGRTLTRETIELKEEIYGNLVARYEDYLARGMGEDEAYRRTCDAVTNIDDVLGGEKNDGAGGARAASPDETVVAPHPASGAAAGAGGPVPPGDAARGGTGGDAARRRWPGWKVAAVAVVAVVAVWLLGSAAFGAVAGLGRDAFQDTTGASVQPVDVDATDVTYTDDAPTGGSVPTTSPTDGGATGATSDVILTTDGLDQAISGHDPAPLAAYADTPWPVPAETVAQIAGGLPLSEHLMSTGADANGYDGNVIVVEYEWVEDERVARTDDDAVERAVVYDATALLCSVSSADSVRVTIHETDGEDGELSVETLTFRRADVEALLGTELTSSRLTDGTWDGLRAQLSQERTYDRAWDRAETD